MSLSPLQLAVARDHSRPVEGDYFATDPAAIPPLVAAEPLGRSVWECCCGAGDLARPLEDAGIRVWASDKYDRGYGRTGADVLAATVRAAPVIVTNPPYGDGFPIQLVRHARKIGVRKVCLLLPMNWWDAARRVDFLTTECPPVRIWNFAGRLRMARNGDWQNTGNSPNRSYSWWVWDFSQPPGPTVARVLRLERMKP